MDTLLKKQLKALNKIGDTQICIDINDRYYVNQPYVYIRDGYILTVPGQHCDTIEEAVKSYVNGLIGKEIVKDNERNKQILLIPVEEV